ncbi:cytochrome c biogenesis protein ResB [Nocardioides sp. cx-173]|uniref:cytochrome c biogenesis protein ResB n=1 Tax=Nocardioides sp. cx-173 TaxID=2898796 RepID=UPI001E5C8C86|nr:cytochrome c biogenesis protein ResB [Nocardioides sp. cx-173]MCD4524111.1 cytochrome c biogenesis protein ResB [Nocardioides sp. cx-173]UGB41508.1 cytochrome c biogenesis protein ResB [Nocardioides sp. cx-173]
MTATLPPEAPERRSGELTPRELGRWLWRQLTSMRTALILLLLLALAAVPGSIIPQEGVDSSKTARWQDEHPTLTPIYERLQLFSVYDSAWFSAIYLLLMVSLVGCIIPRTFVYLRAIRAAPPAAPRNLARLPDHTSYESDAPAGDVLDAARAVLKKRGYRLRPAEPGTDAVSAERGYLREVGNLLFHLSVVVVLVAFAAGSLFGFRGGAIIVEGSTFTNTLTQYDDFEPGQLFSADQMDPFVFTFDDFDVEWQNTPRRGVLARAFKAGLTYRESPTAEEKTYDLRVNHPLSVGDTDVFLIGHGYAPVITVKDGNGDEVFSGPVPFLPQDQSFLSFGVVKVPDSPTGQVGLEGLFYPTFQLIDGNPATIYPNDANPLISMQVYTGDLGLDSGPQSVYDLDKDAAEQVLNDEGKPLRLDLGLGETATLPDGLGTVTFDEVRPWTRIQFSQSPGKEVALAGVVLALVGLLGSLFIRPRRVWVRARREEGVTMVEVAALDRSGGGDVVPVLEELVADLQTAVPHDEEKADT